MLQGGRTAPRTSDAVPTAYNEKVISFLRQPNILDLLKDRHPTISTNPNLRSKINTIRAEGVEALDKLTNDVELIILLSMFENDIMSYVPPMVVSGAPPGSSTRSPHGSPQGSPQASPGEQNMNYIL